MKRLPLLIVAPIPLERSQHFCGSANGYVAVPEDHPWYGKHHDDISGVSIHGGLTFSDKTTFFGQEYWMVGFDTAHLGDTVEKWSLENVQKETQHLYHQAFLAANEY